MAVSLTREDLIVHEPLELGVGDWMVITQERIDEFAHATGDLQWIHVDPVRAAAGPFGSTVAHGYLSLALVPMLLRELLTIVDQSSGINYGLDAVRFLAPVTVGSAVRLEAAIVGGERRPDGGVRYQVRARLEIQGSDRPALVGDVVAVSY
ncbi:MAG: MaoC family dehydratase [Rhodoglobus sp.]